MRFSSEWFDRTPEYHSDAMRKLDKYRILAEDNCKCGIRERHSHCSHCGMLFTMGDWDAPSLTIFEGAL